MPLINCCAVQVSDGEVDFPSLAGFSPTPGVYDATTLAKDPATETAL